MKGPVTRGGGGINENMDYSYSSVAKRFLASGDSIYFCLVLLQSAMHRDGSGGWVGPGVPGP